MPQRPYITGIKTPVPPAWDDWLLRNARLAGFCQTLTRAKVVSSQQDAISYIVQCGDSETEPLAAGLLTLLGKQKSGGVLSCFEGPVLAKSTPEVLDIWLGEAEKLAYSIGASRISFSALPKRADWVKQESFHEIFLNRGYLPTPWATILLNLLPDEEYLFGSFAHAARKGVRKCLNNGVYVERCDSFQQFTEDFLTNYWENKTLLANKLLRAGAWWDDKADAYNFFVAKDSKGRVLATLGTYRFGGMASEIMSARTAASHETGLPAQDLLHWEVFKAHKALGDEVFNLSGYNPEPASAKEEGIRRFKQKWGGEELLFSIWAKSPPSGRLQTLRMSLRNAVLAVVFPFRERKNNL